MNRTENPCVPSSSLGGGTIVGVHKENYSKLSNKLRNFSYFVVTFFHHTYLN